MIFEIQQIHDKVWVEIGVEPPCKSLDDLRPVVSVLGLASLIWIEIIMKPLRECDCRLEYQQICIYKYNAVSFTYYCIFIIGKSKFVIDIYELT